MSKSPSPFDDPVTAINEFAASDAPRRKIPERKWSFITLAVVLFTFAWIRELAGLNAPATLLIAVSILSFWAIVHAKLYTSLLTRRPPAPIDKYEILSPPPGPLRSARRYVALAVGLLTASMMLGLFQMLFARFVMRSYGYSWLAFALPADVQIILLLLSLLMMILAGRQITRALRRTTVPDLVPQRHGILDIPPQPGATNRPDDRT